jgi:hypothetical protein
MAYPPEILDVSGIISRYYNVKKLIGHPIFENR